MELIDKIKGVLVDMDGVLYDSMPYHAKAWQEMFSELGIKTVKEEFFFYEGMTGGATIDLIFHRELGRGATEEEKKSHYARKADLFTSKGKKRLMPGTFSALSMLRNLGKKTVLVTGSAQSTLISRLDRDYPGLFPEGRRITALDVTKGKPDPEPYLKGAEKAGYKPEECMVVENAPLGVRAGKNAGCFTIALMTGPVPREEFEKEGADMIFESPDEFAAWIGTSADFNTFDSAAKEIDNVGKRLNGATVTVVTDSNVNRRVVPLLKKSRLIKENDIVVLPAGESAKTLDNVVKIWDSLENSGATRKSVIVNIGGGSVTDTGGFAAATFKRGIRYVNVPTTILGAVDAATGGKTGINFNGLKNEIGSFHMPCEVMIMPELFMTLDRKEQLSGYAEMLKTALIADESLYQRLRDVNEVLNSEELLGEAVKKCVEIKESVVQEDPKEQGLRKILNFGHTAGHAFETFCREKGNEEVTHGIAVAHGILVALILSRICLDFSGNVVTDYRNLLIDNFPSLGLRCRDHDRIIELMGHDKKNHHEGRPNFTLLQKIGEPVTDCFPSSSEIREALEIYCDMSV